MQLVEFQVEGVRCLTDVSEIPVARPTILTGPNDSGKTAAILGLGFLLGDRLNSDDLTLIEADEAVDNEQTVERAEAIVTGVLQLTAEEQGELQLPEEVTLRRRYHGVTPSYELSTSVPADERLRGLELLTVAQLRELAEDLELATPGHRGRRDTYLGPLNAHAAAAPHVDDWVEAPAELIRRMPRFLHFASTEAPDPERDVRSWLGEVYERIAAEGDVAGQVDEIEQQMQRRLAEEAVGLRDHIRARCEDHADLEVVPNVSFRGGFTVELHHAHATAGDGSLRLRAAGAGSKRRVTLAVWEWVSGVLTERAPADRSLVIAYDEPDTHLDYLRQRDLIDLIKSQADLDGVQVVVATHSLNLIDKVDMRGVVHLEFVAGQPTVRRLFTEEHGGIDEHLQRIAASMGLRNSVLLHERCFLAVEGPTELQSLPILFQAATGLSLQAAGIALVAGNGNEGALNVARFLRENNRTVRFIVDADTRANRHTRKLFIPEKLRQYGFRDDHIYYAGNPSDIEDLFSDETWSSLANEAWPRQDGDPWLPDHFAALRQGEGSFGSRLEDLVRPASTHAPQGKPGYLLAVAERVETRDDVPNELCDVFDDLVAVAS